MDRNQSLLGTGSNYGMLLTAQKASRLFFLSARDIRVARRRVIKNCGEIRGMTV